MKVNDFLIETSEEDRAIVSLASAISRYLYDNYRDTESDSVEFDPELDDESADTDETESVGTVGQLFNTPIDILNPVHIFVQSDYGIRQRARSVSNAGELMTRPEDGAIFGLWYYKKMAMVLNKDFIGSNGLRKAIAHELRHALDDFKSNFKAGTSEYYSTPKKKSHLSDPKLRYLAGPDEINARFLQVLSAMTGHIQRAFSLPDNKIKPVIMSKFREEMEKNSISMLFPEKEKSTHYKRLVKRAMDFIQKEVAYREELSKQSGMPKTARGSYTD